jgi:hypothetical protein
MRKPFHVLFLFTVHSSVTISSIESERIPLHDHRIAFNRMD